MEYEEKRLEALERKRREPVDVGGYGYNHTLDPNPECPRCNGEGVSRVVLQDSTKLEDAAALAYSGVKVGKAGIEITSISRERMFEAVAKRLGLADSENAQRMQRVDIDRRQLEVDKIRKQLEPPEKKEGEIVDLNVLARRLAFALTKAMK